MSWLSDKINGLILKVTYNFGWSGYDVSKNKTRDRTMDSERDLGGSGEAKLKNQGCDVDSTEEAKQNGD